MGMGMEKGTSPSLYFLRSSNSDSENFRFLLVFFLLSSRFLRSHAFSSKLFYYIQKLEIHNTLILNSLPTIIEASRRIKLYILLRKVENIETVCIVNCRVSIHVKGIRWSHLMIFKRKEIK